MSLFVGVAEGSSQPIDNDLLRRISSVAGAYAATPARRWNGDGLALVQVQRIATPEDRHERLPGHFAGGRSVLAFAGRIDNRDDLIAELGLEPERRGLPDGALVMAALERWGDDACPRLIGDFAFAAWDRQRRRLFLACDAGGGQTIYHHITPNGVIFGTMLQCVRAFVDHPHEVDLRSAAHLLLSRPIPTGATMFRDIARLPAAGWMVWSPEGVQQGRYWRPDWGRRIRYRRDDDYVDAARELLDRVITARLRSVGPVVCHLSGGLDSTLVASTAARLVAPAKLHTVTVVPDPDVPTPLLHEGLMADEWPLAELVARQHPNITAHRTPAGALTPDEIDPTRLFRVAGQPVANYINVACFAPSVQKIRELGGAAVLNGLSGNVTLSWQSSALLADLVSSGRLLEAARQIAGTRRNGDSVWRLVRSQLINPFLSPDALRALQRLRGRRPDTWEDFSIINPAFAAEIGADAIYDPGPFESDAPTRDARIRHQWLEQTWAVRANQGAFSWIRGFELRDPLGDRRIVEFCLAIPPEQWQRGGMPRSFARRVLADRVPPEVYGDRRRGFQAAQWFHRLTLRRDEFIAEIDRLEASPLASRILNVPQMRAIAASWPADVQLAQKQYARLMNGFGRGLHIGRFLRWTEGSNL